MNNRKLWFFSSLGVFGLAFFLLVTGSPLLETSLSQKHYIPIGNITTWLGMIALPFSIYWGAKKMRKAVSRLNRFLSRILKILIVLAIFWAPICFFLAGNLAFNFSEVEGFQGGQAAMRWFWRYSYGLPLASIVVLILYWIGRIFGH